MVLSPMAGYAAKALGYMAVNAGTPLQVREIAERTQVPAPYLAKIVHQLGRKGYVRTRRGVGGGVELAIDPARVTLFELCETLEDPILDAQCLLGLGSCNDDRDCPAHAFSKVLRRKKLEFLERTTLLQVGRYDQRRRTQSRRRKGRG